MGFINDIYFTGDIEVCCDDFIILRQSVPNAS